MLQASYTADDDTETDLNDANNHSENQFPINNLQFGTKAKKKRLQMQIRL